MSNMSMSMSFKYTTELEKMAPRIFATLRLQQRHLNQRDELAKKTASQKPRRKTK